MAFFLLQSLVCAILLPLRVPLARRHRLSLALSLGVATLCLLFIAYADATRAEPLLIGTALICLLSAVSILLPWGVEGQLLLVGITLAGYGIHLFVSGPLTVPAMYAFVIVLAGGLSSVLGAHYIDLQRFTIFRESIAKDEAALVTRSLLNVASELNSSLDAETVLTRVVQSARSVLTCDWSVILLWDEARGLFRVAAGSTERKDLLHEAMGIEFRPEDYRIIERLMQNEDLIEISRPYPPEERMRAILAYFRTRSVLVASMTRAGRVVGLMTAGRNSTDQPFLPRQWRLMRGIAQHAAVALENARLVTDLRHADRLKSEFVATMSHELRTPLNIILGYTELLMDGTFGEMNEDQIDTIGRVRQQSHDLLTLINATLDVNRLEAGGMPLELETVDITTLLQEMRLQIDTLPREKDVRIDWQIPHSLTAFTDPNKLKIVLRNLITNALKFTDSGHIEIRAKTAERGNIEFRISDTGIGIPTNELQNIFGMFHQVSLSSRQSTGVGLGLYIVRRFVDLLRGHIEVESVVGKGTTFHVYIPDLADDRPRTTSPLAASLDQPPPRTVRVSS